MASGADVRQLALATLLFGFAGDAPPRWLLDALADGLGGVVLFGSNVGDGSRIDRLTERLRAAAGRHIVVALDEEGGDVTRLDALRGSTSPGAAALGYLDDESATEAAYAVIGQRLGAAGVTLDLAPVADVNVDPLNPVIGVRSFGADSQLVARHVAAAVRGLQQQGVAACAKHFPGHGATAVDSHHELPVLDRTAAELDAVELPPFVAALRAGVRAVMTGHLVVPSLDPENAATVSAAITTTLLREQLGCTASVVTDALEMAAVAGPLGMQRAFVAALAAGADTVETGALEYPDLLVALPEAALRAVDAGVLDPARLRSAAARTADLAQPPDPATAAPLPADLGRRCLEIRGPVPELDRPLVLEARPPANMASGELPWSLARPLAERIPGVTAMGVGGPEEAVAAGAAARSAAALVAVIRDPARHPWQWALVELARAHRAGVVVDVGWPAELPDGVAGIRTRGIAPPLLVAAAQVLAQKP